MALGGLWSRVTGAIVGVAVGRAAADTLTPTFELLRQEAWEARPNRLLGMTEYARLVATGITSFDAAAAAAQRDGFDPNLLRAMVEYYLNPPQYGYAYESLRRGDIDEQQFRHLLTKQGIERGFHDALLKLRWLLPSVTDMVRFAVREVYNPSQRSFLEIDAEFPPAFAAAAEQIGIPLEQAKDYWAAHWELPSYTQLTEMRFRGLLTEQEYADALKAIDLAPIWREKMFAIARRIPTITDMVRFAVREVYNPQLRQSLGYELEYPDDFTPQAALHGLSEEHARQYWIAHWRLPSARQGYQMFWRGEITEAQLRDLLKALDYPQPWRTPLMNIAHIVPGRIDLKRLLKYGIIDQAETLEGYKRIGYAPQDAERMTQIAVTEMSSSAVGLPWFAKAQSRLFTVAHDEYLDFTIDEPIARGILSQLDISEAEQTLVIAAWDAEQAIFRRELTIPQILKLVKKSVWTRDKGLEALVELGLRVDDADDLLTAG